MVTSLFELGRSQELVGNKRSNRRDDGGLFSRLVSSSCSLDRSSQGSSTTVGMTNPRVGANFLPELTVCEMCLFELAVAAGEKRTGRSACATQDVRMGRWAVSQAARPPAISATR
jgi:hypothetical protein